GSLRGEKGDLYEGGIRVPMIVRWPWKIMPGKVSDLPWAVSIRQRGVTQASKYESALRMLLMGLESRPDERPRATYFH
ncbi:MAG: hypothetical protein M3R15_31515, partial [Acidobacteriota bacterium]|nr:hypothetical protein [Acidobacteriota bacterium]